MSVLVGCAASSTSTSSSSSLPAGFSSSPAGFPALSQLHAAQPGLRLVPMPCRGEHWGTCNATHHLLVVEFRGAVVAMLDGTVHGAE